MESISSHHSSLFYNNPLFNIIISFYIIIFLFFSNLFLKSIISPTLISTLILLLFILRLGTSQQQQSLRLELETRSVTKLELEPNTKIDPTKTEPDPKPALECTTLYQNNKPNPAQYCTDNFEEWTVWGPLEVIYEAYEGEEGEDETQNDAFKEPSEKYASLSRYYPESESDTDTDTSSSYSLDEDFLEIALDYEFGDKRGNVMNKLSKEVDEEDNLIEIDISPNKNDNECGFIW